MNIREVLRRKLHLANNSQSDLLATYGEAEGAFTGALERFNYYRGVGRMLRHDKPYILDSIDYEPVTVETDDGTVLRTFVSFREQPPGQVRVDLQTENGSITDARILGKPLFRVSAELETVVIDEDWKIGLVARGEFRDVTPMLSRAPIDPHPVLLLERRTRVLADMAKRLEEFANSKGFDERFPRDFPHSSQIRPHQ